MTIAAVYRNGVFLPEGPVSLPEGTRVEIVTPDPPAAEQVLAAMKKRYPGTIGELAPGEADQMRRDIDEAFGLILSR